MEVIRQEARHAVIDWLTNEYIYVASKWGASREQDDEELAEKGVNEDSRWRRDIEQYIHRATILGLENPLGQQALLKGLATIMECCTSMVMVYGNPPKGGVPSGEL